VISQASLASLRKHQQRTDILGYEVDDPRVEVWKAGNLAGHMWELSGVP